MVKLAVVGCGHMGSIHSSNAQHIPELETYAYVDTVIERAEEFKARFGGAYATSDLEVALSDPAVDAVIVTTRWKLHAPIATAALRAGKHVFIEKPLAPTIDESKQIEAAAKESGRQAMVAFNQRFAPIVNQARQIVGPPVMTTSQCMDRPWAPDYNSIIDQACHSIDTICFIHGAYPVGYSAVGGNYNGSDWPVDNLAAAFTFADGSVSSLVQGDLGVNPFTSKWSLQIVGHERGAFVDDRLRRARFWGCETDEVRIATHDGNLGPSGYMGHFEELRAFGQALATGGAVPVDVTHGRKIMEIVLGLMESAANSASQARG